MGRTPGTSRDHASLTGPSIASTFVSISPDIVVQSVSKFSTGFLVVLAVLICLAHALAALTASIGKSMTADEIAYLTAGHSYNVRGDYRLHPENGILPQRWAALPLTLSGTPLPPATLGAWQKGDVWKYGHTLFYESGLSADELLLAGRAMTALFSAATGLLIFFWSRSLFGWRGAFLSLGLFAFCPSFLAHGALATSDVAMTFFFLASVGAWWRQLERPTITNVALSACTLGLACVVKYSAVLLAPIFALIALAWWMDRKRQAGWRAPSAWLTRIALVHLVVAWLTIWLFYGFRFSAFAPGLADNAHFYRGDWEWILADLGWPRPFIESLRRIHALPEAFLYGFTFVLQFSRARGAFLNGENGINGWFVFFPYAFLVKTTLGFLLLVSTGAVLGVKRSLQTVRLEGLAPLWSQLKVFTPLAALFAVYWATSLTSHLNIGQRHILPTYPVLFILAGAFGHWLTPRRRAAGLLVGALLLGHIVESTLSRPHYLAFFNPIAGGRNNGWRHLVDSSLDWGQELPGLKTWLDTHARDERVFLSYFGSGDPRYEGIRSMALPSLPEWGAAQSPQRLEAGIYAISATMLQQTYSPIRGPWTLELEKEFQSLRQRSIPSAGADPGGWRRFEQLRFARLCWWLRVRPPEAIIGGAILIYRLTSAEAKAATDGPLSEWTALIEHTIQARKP